MSALVGWNRRWYHPGESLWSVANKLAFVACSSVADVLRLLAGVVERSREGWLFPSADKAVEVCELLNLPLAAAHGELFASVRGLPTLKERENWQLGIRYCRACLDGFVHRAVFQDRRVTSCPVHGTRLLEGCPVCNAPLDPTCGDAWSCAYCGMTLAVPGRGWPRQFLAGPKPTAGRDQATAPAVMAPIAMPNMLLEQWVAQVAYEEHSAIWSTLLGGHVDCTQRDIDACDADAMPCRFGCPVAGAAWQSAKTMGIHPQFAAGAWARKKPGRGQGLTNAVFLVAELPADRVDVAVRALVRQWTLELLEAFTAAAQAGQTVADWPGCSLRLPVPNAKIYDQLTDLAARAGELCRLAELDSFHSTIFTR